MYIGEFTFLRRVAVKVSRQLFNVFATCVLELGELLSESPFVFAHALSRGGESIKIPDNFSVFLSHVLWSSLSFFP